MKRKISFDSAPEFLKEPEYRNLVIKARQLVGSDEKKTWSSNSQFTPTTTSTEPQVGDFIGNYQLLEKIGQGGMGTVWKASQSHPVKRDLAIKLVQYRDNVSELESRLQSERQALALMDHPGIARMIDAGATDDGQPFFAMELFEGDSLNRFCNRVRMTIRQRLTLFVEICSAVQHAHQKGVIHRDLKPGNILVKDVDGQPRTKVIDFGLAKAVKQFVPIGDEETMFGQVLGTLQYMSPEQADSDAARADTRSDVYSLGAVLYELLCGDSPLAEILGPRMPIRKAVECVVNVDPQLPSIRVASVSADDARFSDRHVDRATLQTMLAGDLDWVIMKAIDKAPDQRYQAVSELAADVKRFLDGEPVLARPHSFVYRAKKFVSRYRWTVAASTAIALTLIAGIIASSIGWSRALEAEGLADLRFHESERARKAESIAKLAEAERAEGEKKAKEHAEDLLDQTQQYNEILRSIVKDFNVRRKQKDSVPLEQRLADRLIAAGEQVAARQYDGPKFQVQLLHDFGRTLISLGYPNEALSLFERLDEIVFDKELQKDMGWVAWAENSLANSLIAAGEPEQAKILAARSAERYVQLNGRSNKNTLSSLHVLAVCELLTGDYDQAIENLEFVVPQRIELHGPAHKTTLISMSVLATAYERIGELEKARELMEKVLHARQQTLGPEAVGTVTTMSNLADILAQLGEIEAGLELQTEAADLFEKNLGSEHPNTLAVKSKLAVFYRDTGELDQARKLVAPAIPLMEERLGPAHPRTLIARSTLASIVLEQQGPAVAVPMYRDVYQLAVEEHGLSKPDTLHVGIGFATALVSDDQDQDAQQILLQLKEEWQPRIGDSHKSIRKIDQLLDEISGQQNNSAEDF